MHLSKKQLHPDSLFDEARQEAWWGKNNHARKRPYLLARNAALAAARTFFAARDFIEVETSVLRRSPGNEVHLHAFATEARAADGALKEKLYLPTSPEFDCKKILAAGEKKIFTLAKSFRNREEGPLHAREFIMLEWYRAGSPLEQLIEDCVGFVQAMARVCNASSLTYNGKGADPFIKPEILTVGAALERFAQIDIDHVIDNNGNWKRAGLARAAKRLNVRVAEDDTAGDIFSRILVGKIEPRLGQGQMTFLTCYPMEDAALARACDNDPRYAGRFELYACGVELANAFAELTDATEQRARFKAAMDEKQRIYNERYPVDEGFLEALAQMPPACGIALGFERLLMLLLGAKNIRDVMWAP